MAHPGLHSIGITPGYTTSDNDMFSAMFSPIPVTNNSEVITPSNSPWKDPLQIAQFVTIVVGFVANSVTLITLGLNGGDFSPVLLILFRHQSVIDGVLCVVSGIQMVQTTRWQLGQFVIDIVVCHVWHSTYIFGNLLNYSAWNLVVISWERYMAVCKPFRHQDITKRKVCVIIAVLDIMFLVVNIPLMLNTTYQNDTCILQRSFQSKGIKMLMTIASLLSFLYNYIIPIVCFAISYGSVILTFRRRTKSEILASSKVIDKASRELTKTAITVTLIYIFSMALAYWNYILGRLGVIPYDITSFVRRLGVWLMSFNACANPFVYTILIPAFQKSLKKTFCKIQ